MFIIYADFESILVTENSWGKNSERVLYKKCQRHIAWSYEHKLVCLNDKFISLLKHN